MMMINAVMKNDNDSDDDIADCDATDHVNHCEYRNDDDDNDNDDDDGDVNYDE